MVRQRLLSPVRFILVIALLSALFIATAGVVSAAPTITASPGTAPLRRGGTTDTFDLSFASITADLDVDCGSPSSQCSVWVARNNAAKATEALFTNVTGARTLIPVGFINDGCFNFRLYDSAHSNLLGQINIGHGTGIALNSVCNADGTGKAIVLTDGVLGITHLLASGTQAAAPTQSIVIDWDSGGTGGVDDSQVWVRQSKPGDSITDCAAVSYPNANEILFAQNVSGEQRLSLDGGGPYCFALYQGTSHMTKSAGPSRASIDPYLQYVGGAPNGSNDPAQGTVYYTSGNGATNALVCVGGIGRSTLPFSFNSFGFDHKVATFQTAGAGLYFYSLRTGVGAFDANGNATASSCGTGTQVTQIQITT